MNTYSFSEKGKGISKVTYSLAEKENSYCNNAYSLQKKTAKFYKIIAYFFLKLTVSTGQKEWFTNSSETLGLKRRASP